MNYPRGSTFRSKFSTRNLLSGQYETPSPAPTGTIYRNGASAGSPTLTPTGTGKYDVTFTVGAGWAVGDQIRVEAEWSILGVPDNWSREFTVDDAGAVWDVTSAVHTAAGTFAQLVGIVHDYAQNASTQAEFGVGLIGGLISDVDAVAADVILLQGDIDQVLIDVGEIAVATPAQIWAYNNRTLTGAQTVTYSNPVDVTNGNRLTLVKGDDYTEGTGRIPRWLIEDYAGPTLKAVGTLRISKAGGKSPQIEVATAIATDGSDLVITAPIPEAESVLLTGETEDADEDTHRYQLIGFSDAADGDVTLVIAPATVLSRINPES